MVGTKRSVVRRGTWQQDICSALVAALSVSWKPLPKKRMPLEAQVEVSGGEVGDMPVFQGSENDSSGQKKEELPWQGVVEYTLPEICEYKGQYMNSVSPFARVGLDWFDRLASYQRDRPSVGATLHEFLTCSEDDAEREHLMRILLDPLLVSDPREEVMKVLCGWIDRY